MRLFDLNCSEDIHRLEEMLPLSQRGLPSHTPQLLREACLKHWDRPMLTYLPRPEDTQHSDTVTYGQFYSQLGLVVAAFSNASGGKSDSVVSIISGATIETHLTVWAAQHLGCAAPINPYLDVSSVQQLLKKVAPDILVIQKHLHGLPILEKYSNLLAALPSLKAVYVIGADEGDLTELGNQISVKPFSSILNTVPAASLPSCEWLEPTRTCCLFHTGGTTGVPKYVRHTHSNQALSAALMAERLGWTPDDSILMALPLFHVNGLLLTGLSAFHAGAHVVLGGSAGFRDPALLENYWQIVDDFEISFISGVPTIYSALLERSESTSQHPSLRFGICGGAPLSPFLHQQIEQRLHIKLLEGYGLTEGTIAVTLNPPNGERRTGSIGLRLPYQDVRIVTFGADDNSYECCSDNEVGELIVKGYNVTPGYLDDIHNVRAFTHDGYLITGDRVRRDSDGYYWLLGRSKDVIIRGGHNIDPCVIEDALVSLPGVRQAAAVGMPDAYAGEIPVAYIVKDPSCEISVTNILSDLASIISERAAIPKRIFFVSELPVTSVGKVDKLELRRQVLGYKVESILQDRQLKVDCSVITNRDGSHTANLVLEHDPPKGLINDLDRIGVSYTFIHMPIGAR